MYVSLCKRIERLQWQQAQLADVQKLHDTIWFQRNAKSSNDYLIEVGKCRRTVTVNWMTSTGVCKNPHQELCRKAACIIRHAQTRACYPQIVFRSTSRHLRARSILHLCSSFHHIISAFALSLWGAMADHDLQGLHQEYELLKSVEFRKNELIQVSIGFSTGSHRHVSINGGPMGGSLKRLGALTSPRNYSVVSTE